MAPKAKAPAAKPEAKKKEEEEKKRKAEEKAEDTAPKKEAKKEEPKKAKKEEEDDSGEKEKDAVKDNRSKVKETASFYPSDCTLNVVPTLGGKVLMALSEGGMQYLIAGARGNVGMKAGRYMFEVKIIEALNPAEASQGQRGRVPMPRQLVRLGFSAAGSSLILGDSNDAAFFDSEGSYVAGKTKKASASQRFTRDQVIAVVLNLDPKSPNNNTISLFREGERISEPQQLPENLHGKPLFPHVCFRNVTVQMLFGPEPAKKLPFQCRMIQGAAQADAVVAPNPEPKDGKYEVMMPVAFPDEGTFDWLDTWLESHPNFVELSDRKILEWAASSGLWKPKGGGWKTSNDKPEFNFGLTGMDDFSVRRVINAVAPVVPRNYIIMEVKSNLVASERKEVLSRFNAPHFKRVAHVVMGEPNAAYKEKQLGKLLKEKQEKADAEWKAKKAEEQRKKQLEQRQKDLAERRKKAAEEAKKKQEELAKKKAEAAKAKEAAEKKDSEKEGEEKKEEEAKEEETKAEPMETDETKEEPKEEPKEEVKEEEEKKDEEMEDKAEEGPPQVELTEEEQKMWFKTPSSTSPGDLTSLVLSQSFANFTIPESEEGFDDIRYEWQNADKSKEYLRKWVLDRKLTSRIEDLQPGQWFTDKLAEWTKTFQEWQNKQKEYKNSAAKKAKDEEKKKEEERKKAEAEGGEEEPKDAEMEGDDLDIFSVEDVCDTGSGEPLFSNFTFEDWALLQLRFDLYVLQLAFKKDVDDPERIGIHDTHLAFYYNKYYRKQLNPKYFGPNLNSNAELCKLVKDTVSISETTNVLVSTLAEDTENVDIFVKLTEENRRERQRRIDAGDETAKLKFSPMAMQQPQAAKAGAAAGVRPAGAWQQGQVRPAGQQWGAAAAGKGAGFQAGGFRPPMAGGGAWGAGARPAYAPRGPAYQQKWR